MCGLKTVPFTLVSYRRTIRFGAKFASKQMCSLNLAVPARCILVMCTSGPDAAAPGNLPDSQHKAITVHGCVAGQLLPTNNKYY